jgi:hypothetical protein
MEETCFHINDPSVNWCAGQIAVMVLMYDKKIDIIFSFVIQLVPGCKNTGNKQAL